MTGSLRSWVGRVAVAVLCAGTLVAATRGSAAPPARVDLRSGGAWVASSRVGLMTLIDGRSAEVAARVEVGAPTSRLAATQAAGVGYALDVDRGTLVRVDPRTFVPSLPVALVPSPSAHLAARAGDEAVYVLDEDRGRVAVATPDGLVPYPDADVSVAGRVASSVVDGDGRLWLLGTDGTLVWFDGPVRHDRSASPGPSELLAAGGRPVVVDRQAGTVSRLGPSGRASASACVDGAGDPTASFGGGDDERSVFAVSGAQGVLRVSDLATGTCTRTAVPVATPGHTLGTPVGVDRHVFVPDYTDGTVAVVDLDDQRVTRTAEPVAPGRFELFAVDGIVFYNDPDSEKAGVIHLDGTFTAVEKYDPSAPDQDLDNPGPPASSNPTSPADPTTPTNPAASAPPDPAAGPATTPPVSPPDPGGPTSVPLGTTAPSPTSTGPITSGPAGPTTSGPAGPTTSGPAGPTTTRPSGPTTSGPPVSGPIPTRPPSTPTTPTTTTTTQPSTTTTATQPPATTTTSEPVDPTGTEPGPAPTIPRPGNPPTTVRPTPTTRPRPITTTTTTTTTTTAPCPGPDSDGDGVPDSCDPTDGSAPLARVDSIATSVERRAVVLDVTASVTDPQSGVRRMEMVVQYSFRCPLSSGDFRGSETVPGEGVSSVSTRIRLSCPQLTEAVEIAVTVLVRGTNGHGVQGAPQAFDYACPSRGACFPALSAARATAGSSGR